MIGSRIRTRRSRAIGYTLIELLIVITLLGIAATLLIPHMVGQATMETQAAVRMIIADLSFAQSDALAHQEYRRVYFFEDGRGYAIMRVDSPDSTVNPDDNPGQVDYIYDPLAPAGHNSHYIVDFQTNKRFSNVSISEVEIDGTNRFITYDQLGGTIAPNGTSGGSGKITVTSGDQTFRIDISPFTGKLTVERID